MSAAWFVRVLLWAAATAAVACARENVELDPGADAPQAGARSMTPRAREPTAVPSQAARVFDHGLCTCTSASFPGSFVLDAFDSRDGPYAGGQSGADVGVNDQLATTSAFEVRGALVAAGSGLLAMTNGPVSIEGNLETNAALAIVGAEVALRGDLWVNGAIQAVGSVTVAGDVHQPPGQAGADALITGGEIFREPFTVGRPCPCGADAPLDLEALVTEGLSRNDNRARGIAAGALFTAPKATLDLPCGRFGFAGGLVLGDSEVKAHGSAALFVEGDLTIGGRLGVDLPEGAVLDVFVSGNLILADGAEVGTPARPAALRFYVAGPGDIAVTGTLGFAANLYAPLASVFLTSEQELYGSLFVEGYQGIVSQRMHYDRAVLHSAGDATCP